MNQKENAYQNLLLGIPCLIFLVLSLIYVKYAAWIGDEGWYLLACQKVYQGKVLYRDFGYTQTPIMPYLYGFVLKYLGFHMLTGRFVSWVLILSTFIVSILISNKLGCYRSTFLTAWIFACSPFILHYSIIVATNALTALFILLSIYFFILEKSVVNRSLSMIFIMFAAGTRMTVLPGWFVLAVFLYLENRFNKVFWVPVVLSVIAGASFIIPFMYLDKESFLFYNYGYHQQWVPSIPSILKYKLFCLTEFEQFNPIWLILGIGVFLVYLKKGLFRSMKLSGWLILILCLGLILFQLSLKHAGGAYLINIFPLTVIAIGLGIDRILSVVQLSKRDIYAVTAVFILACLLTVVLGTSGVLNFRNYEGKRLSDTEYISIIASYIQQNTKENTKILTLDSILGVESGRDVLPGTEMSVFSYYPDWSSEKAERFHALNTEMLNEYIESTTAGVIAISDHSFQGDFATAIRSNQDQTTLLRKKIEDYYNLAKVYKEFGPVEANISLYIYFPKYESPK